MRGDGARVAAFLRGLDGFDFVEDLAIPYNHMGATITDAVLQAGLPYEATVWPRVQHVMTISEAATTSGFLRALRERGGEKVVPLDAPRQARPHGGGGRAVRRGGRRDRGRPAAVAVR